MDNYLAQSPKKTYRTDEVPMILISIANFLNIVYFGFIGGAIAQSVNFWFILFATLGMIKCKGYHKKCWG